ncbi:MAG: D-aminoacyl-tRNA deacylase [Candidatus Micrarchaeia archaeon]
MIGIFYSNQDKASLNIANYLKREYSFSENSVSGKRCFSRGDVNIYETNDQLINLDDLDGYGLELIFFLSKHSSAQGISAFTTHATGNWTREARLGGKPYELSYAAPLEMLEMLRNYKKKNIEGIEVTYEATHHGPLLKTPSLFVEIGGNQSTIENEEYAKVVGDAVYGVLDKKNIEFEKVAIGIGNTHYPMRFTELALSKGYAFAHMLPKYAIENNGENFFMLEQAVIRSSKPIDAAVIDWKSINSETRNKVIAELNKLGLDYERA